MVVIGVGAIFYAANNGIANDLSFGNILPHLGWPDWHFLPVIVYNFLGFELMSSAGGEMKNPSKDIPTAIIISGLLISVFYILGTIGMLMAIPLEDPGAGERHYRFPQSHLWRNRRWFFSRYSPGNRRPFLFVRQHGHLDNGR